MRSFLTGLTYKERRRLCEFNLGLSVAVPTVLLMRDDANKFVTYLAMIAAPFAMGAFFLAWAPSAQFASEDPAGDGYVPPRSIEQLVERTQESTVTVWCDLGKGAFSQGSGWAIDLETDVSEEFPTALITNHHVIEDCINGAGVVTINRLFEEEVEAVIVKWDEENDLALLATAIDLPALPLSENIPWPGYWMMAVGSADGNEGSVSFGNVFNLNSTEVLLTNNISPGSSGGPLIDNEGYVVGVTTWGLDLEQYNGAKSLDAFCAKILECEYEFDGEKTWWDWND
jgi:serine protease Do